MEDKIEEIIRGYLRREFNNENAIPGLMIKGLAKEIDKAKFRIHDYVDNECAKEDIREAAENCEVELDEDDIEWVLTRYQRAQDYSGSGNFELICAIVEDLAVEKEKTLSSSK